MVFHRTVRMVPIKIDKKYFGELFIVDFENKKIHQLFSQNFSNTTLLIFMILGLIHYRSYKNH